MPIGTMSDNQLLLGDRIELALIGIGLTKERWAAFRQQFGEPPGADCEGCEQRQTDLNAADLYMRNAYAELGSAATAAISKFWAPISYFRNHGKEPVQSGISPDEPPTIEG